MTTRVTTVRIPEDLLELVEAVARVDGVPTSEVIPTAIAAYVDDRRAKADFQARLRERIAADAHVLDRLSR